MKLIGIIPARMAASRFPGKPLFRIVDRPMVAHVYGRASLYNKWDHLSIATCDDIIRDFALEHRFNCTMTKDTHIRALDRVAEAVEKITAFEPADDDIVVNVQGDEPMMHPEMFDALIEPILNHNHIQATILAMSIEEEEIWRNPDTVKLIYNSFGEILYTSRAAVPYNGGKFSLDIDTRRIYGLFAFKWKYLKKFAAHPETRLEKLEACDSNRILDMDFRQYIAPYPYIKSYSVDNPNDISLVEKHMQQDKYWGKY